MLYVPSRFKTQRKMFPQNNFHYMKHYNIGYGNRSYVRNTEYQLQFTVNDTKDTSFHERPNFPIQNTNLVNPKFTLEKPMQIKNEDRTTRLEKAQAKRKSEQQTKKGLLPEQKQDSFRVNNFNINAPQSPKEQIPHFKAPISRQSKTPLRINYKAPLEPIIETKVTENADYIPPANNKVSEKKLRAIRYREYLDMQMRYNNERAEYDKLEKRRVNELFNKKNEDLKHVEKLLAIEERVFKEQLAQEYKKEMEQFRINNPHKLNYPADNICNLLEVNRKRYFEVRVQLTE